ncbi:aspartyl/asparaginyl beta-hydroxylase domain-containing protein [Sphingomonas jatrophae]|uniref:Tetratricopeptide repeat-containing protein n=1 Tax=Sphingomonas jatrophae TaxID=1166337 RepID=A0A1I6KAT1_9SPHN|nr:aspartyl/asparaginyl beta-hydroxylase domain-containing protein [Sphingomonas jatrophae]SFR88319.1 Tetratricopeptide repeat-containing protein [Sphingomonas jatrophae]
MPPDLSALLQAAAEARGAGRRDEARALLEQAVARHPDQPAGLNGLGLALLGAGEAERAAALFRRAVAVDPTALPLRMNLATAARAAGQSETEREALRAALALDQCNLTALTRLAELHERLGEEAAAVERWSAVVAAGRLIDQPSPALAAVLDHAARFVAERTRQLGETLDIILSDRFGDLAAGETRRMAAAVDAMLGRRRIYANQCTGLHVPFLPADEYFERRHFPWLAAVEAQTDAIRAEALALLDDDGAGFRPYVELLPGTPENLWTPLDGSSDWSAVHLFRHGVRDNALCARCPLTAATLAAVPQPDLPARSPTAFFSVLRPGARIPPHGGVTNIRATVHLPLVVPPGCGFRVGGETRAWEEGRAFVFDDTIEHEAWNEGDALRILLIFDVWNPHLTAAERCMVADVFAASDRHRDGLAS